jgi:hypothetical protein
MKDHRAIPQSLVKLMDPKDRKSLGVRTNEEVAAQNDLTLEREIHNQFIGWLRRHDFLDSYHSDPVRRPTIKAGLPDFGVYRNSRILFIEFKIATGRLSAVQEETFQRMGSQGNVILVCHSYDEAAKATAQFFGL